MPTKKMPQGPNETALATFVERNADQIVHNDKGSELPSVRREDMSSSFLGLVKKCGEEVDNEAERNAKKIEEATQRKEKASQKKREASLRRQNRKEAWHDRLEEASKILEPVTTRISKHITTPVKEKMDAGLNLVSMSYKEYADAINAENTAYNQARFALLTKAVEESIVPGIKALSQVDRRSHFDLYKVNGYFGKDDIFSREDFKKSGIHYVAVEKQGYLSLSSEKATNIVVMSLCDSGRIEIRGNCEAYSNVMKNEAVWIRTNAWNNDDMDVMWWRNAYKDLTIETIHSDKRRYYERYLGFNKKATSRITDKIKEPVIEKAKYAFAQMIIRQGLYSAPTNG